MFEIKFDLKKELKNSKNKEEVYNMAYNTFCVKFVETMRNNGFNLKQILDGGSAYFAMTMPVGVEKKDKPIHKKQNKKPATNEELEEARKAGDLKNV